MGDMVFSRLYGVLAQTTQPLSEFQRLLEKLGLQYLVRETPWWGWLALLGGIFVGVLAGKLVAELFRSASDRAKRRNAPVLATMLRSAATPGSLLCVTIGLATGLGFIFMDGGLRLVVGKTMTLLYVLSFGWFLFNLVDLVDLAMHSLASKTQSHLDDQLAPLIRKSVRIFVVVLVGLYVAQNVFNQDITAWLAGLGIAGLAVSLAAQDSIKNLFGSITILLDKPFAVGDRIVFDGFDGPVEEIGFRSTKMRTLEGELVTVPNSKFIDNSVKNVAKRGAISKGILLLVEGQTPPEKVGRLVEALRGALAEPGLKEPFDWEKAPPRVYLDEVRGDNLAVRVTMWYPVKVEWWSLCDHLQRANLRVLEVLQEQGVELASPVKTVILDRK
jgi:MscS family membrane protein